MGSSDMLWYRLCEADRNEFGHSDDWMPIDLDKIMDTPAGRLERWERECGGYPIEAAIAEIQRGFLSARGTRLLVWIGRKQNGDATLKTDDNRPESWEAFNPRTLRIEMQRQAESPAVDAEEEGEDPPPLGVTQAGSPDPAE